MKNFKKILIALVAVAAGIIYFAQELGTLLYQVEDEKKEVAKAVSQWQEKVEDSAQELWENSEKTVKEYTKKIKRTETAVAGTEILSGIEIPVLQTDVPSQILEYTGHTLSYNNETRLPNWVAYELTKEEAQGKNPRKDKFARDPEAKGAQASKEDYRNSGWDRGHMAPAADMKWSTQAMDETYYFTNICPQNHQLNNGDWKELEEKCREWAVKYSSIHIVCGPIIKDNTHGRLGENQIVIPDKFYKVLLILKDGKYQGAGFIFTNYPKRDSKISTRPGPDNPLEYYMVSIDEVESVTGIDFFSKLPDTIEAAVEKESVLFQ